MPELERPYWIVSTHLGHTVVYGRFVTMAEALAGAAVRSAETGQTHELIQVRIHEPGAVVGLGEEVWTVMVIERHDVVCGKYTTEEVALREAAVCQQNSRARHSLLIVKVLKY